MWRNLIKLWCDMIMIVKKPYPIVRWWHRVGATFAQAQKTHLFLLQLRKVFVTIKKSVIEFGLLWQNIFVTNNYKVLIWFIPNADLTWNDISLTIFLLPPVPSCILAFILHHWGQVVLMKKYQVTNKICTMIAMITKCLLPGICKNLYF